MIFATWRGRGWLVILLVAAAMVLPMLVLRQIDGPAVDRGVGLAMGIAALAALLLGLRWNRGGAPGQPAEHALWGLPVQVWALPMLVFAALLGTRVIITEEEPRRPPIPREAPPLLKQQPG
ncbi:hypothetical protein [Roseomonas sp. BN140053]|uniref:hypothetical protein n=1 Tax=Roseomonas sp. BN140053 TaxID=3391898 RepID=UPI0039E7FA50